MKQATINYIIAAATVVAFTLLAVIIPPVVSTGQPTKESPVDTVKYAKYRSDSIGLEAVKWLGEVERERVKVDGLNQAVEANKQKAQEVSRWVKRLVARNKKASTKVKHVPVYFPIPSMINSGDNIIVNTYTAPKIEGTKIRDYPTYFEWKQSRGLLQKKDYETYLKKIYGK